MFSRTIPNQCLIECVKRAFIAWCWLQAVWCANVLHQSEGWMAAINKWRGQRQEDNPIRYVADRMLVIIHHMSSCWMKTASSITAVFRFLPNNSTFVSTTQGLIALTRYSVMVAFSPKFAYLSMSRMRQQIYTVSNTGLPKKVTQKTTVFFSKTIQVTKISSLSRGIAGWASGLQSGDDIS